MFFAGPAPESKSRFSGGGGYQYEKGKERGERQRKVERGDCISLKKDKNKQTNFSFKLFFCSPFEGQWRNSRIGIRIHLPRFGKKWVQKFFLSGLSGRSSAGKNQKQSYEGQHYLLQLRVNETYWILSFCNSEEVFNFVEPEWFLD